MGWRRPILRWNCRMIRIEKKQWRLVIALIALAVAGGVVVVTSGFNVGARERSPEFGDATHLIGLQDPAAKHLLSAAQGEFQTADVVELATVTPVGSASPVQVKAFDPSGPNVRALASIVEGRYPASASEIAVTQRLLARLGTRLGEQLELDGESLTVTGIVENSLLLTDQFVFAPRGVFDPTEVRILVTTTDAELDQFREANPGFWETKETENARTATTVLLTLATAVVLLEVTLLVISVITMLAQRRVRQLGLLAAVGAGKKQIRSAVVSAGVVAGIISAGIGALIGVGVSAVVVPNLETFANRRITQVDWPWMAIGAIALLALAATASSAWWPGRIMSKATVAGALAGRRPRSTRPVVMTVVGLILLGLGVVGLVSLFSLEDRDRPVFLDVVALLAIPLGSVLLAPAAVRLLGRWPLLRGVAARLAQRDLRRYQSRSAATTAALIVILMIPIMAATGFRIFAQSPSSVPSMAGEHLQITPSNINPADSGATDQQGFTSAVEALVGEAQVVELRQPVFIVGGSSQGPVVINRGGLGEGEELVADDFRQPLTFGVITERSGVDFGLEVIPTYVGTPELMAVLGLSGFDGADIITNRAGPHGAIDLEAGDVSLDQSMKVAVVDFPRFSVTPGAVIEPGYASELGLPVETTGWLISGSEEFSDEDIARITQDAATLGLTVSSRTEVDTGSGVIVGSVLGATLLAIGVVAIVGSLHRAETSSSAATFEAVGADLTFRRRVHGMTMGLLALLAGCVAALAGLLSQIGFAIEILGVGGIWRSIPLLVVVLVVTVVPVVAYAFGYFTTEKSYLK